ncbi:MAG: hypothetical protein QNK05_24330 [Myxococcota bacterium]|nr:hypothetical protein [Myxococcota bacterium]
MYRCYALLPLAILSLALLHQPASAEVVHMEEDCAAAGLTLGTDCFEDLTAVSDWLWGGATPRDPTASSRVVVDVGEGTFSGAMACPSYLSTPLVNEPGVPNGWTTFRGLSRTASRVLGGAVLALSTDCDGLEFQDLYFEATGIGFIWWGEGSATFTDVHIKAAYTAWYDSFCAGAIGDPPTGEHYFFASRLESGSLGYFADCGITWFYGSEILVRPNDTTFLPTFGSLGTAILGVKAAHRGDVRLFGSALRIDTRALTATTPAYGVVAGAGGNGKSGGGVFHMHGGIINVTADDSRDIYGVVVDDFGTGVAGLAHTLDTAFAMHVGAGGSATRTSGNGTIKSPLLWESGTDEPVSGINSLNGQDLFVETDCDATGCDGSATDPRPHLMIYSAECESSPSGDGTPWFDVVRGACRN